MTVLIVDDNRLIRKALRAMLEAEGEECVEAGTGGEAIKLARSESPAVCLLDLHLPDLDGIDVLRALQADPKTRGMGVYIVSGSDIPAAQEQAERAGALGYLVKPVKAESLLAMIRGR